MATTKTAKKAAPKTSKKAAPAKKTTKAAPAKKTQKKAKKGVPTLTGREAVAMRDLWESSRGNGHDFGYSDDLPHIPKASRGGIIASLQAKGLIEVHEPVKTDTGTYTQFKFTDIGEVMFDNFEKSKELVVQAVQGEAKARAEKAEKTTKKPAPVQKADTREHIDASWRVFPISDSLRQGLKDIRDASTAEICLRNVVTTCVEEKLPALVEAIVNLRLDTQRGTEDNPVRPIRMQLDNATISKLRYAANQLGIPAQSLMLACCRMSVK